MKSQGSGGFGGAVTDTVTAGRVSSCSRRASEVPPGLRDAGQREAAARLEHVGHLVDAPAGHRAAILPVLALRRIDVDPHAGRRGEGEGRHRHGRHIVGLARDGAHQRVAGLERLRRCGNPLLLQRRVRGGDQRLRGIDARRHGDREPRRRARRGADLVAGAIEQGHLGRGHGERAAPACVEREFEALADAVRQGGRLGLEAQDLRAGDLGQHDARRPQHLAGEQHVDIDGDPLADHRAGLGLDAGAHGCRLLRERRRGEQEHEQGEQRPHGFCSS